MTENEGGPLDAVRTLTRDRTPRARCHSCGSVTVAALCCRCHRQLCARHAHRTDLSRARRLLTRPEPEEKPAPAVVEQPGDDEPADQAPVASDSDTGENGRRSTPRPSPSGPKGRDVPEPRTDRAEAKLVKQRHFCQDCVPLGGPFDLEIVVAVAVLLLGVALVPFGYLWLGLLLAGIGVIRIPVRLALGHRRRRRRQRRTAIFLDPAIRKLSIIETLRGRAELDADRRYASTVEEVAGEIQVKAAWPRAHTELIENYRTLHRLRPDDSVEVESGAVLIRGPARLTLQDVAPGVLIHPTTVLLRPNTSEHEVLRNADGRGDPRWNITLNYAITPPEAGWSVPVWITPTISPGSDRRALEIEVQWRMREPGDHRLADEHAPQAKEIKELTIYVPAEWGEVESLSGAERVTVSTPADGMRCIEWRKPEGVVTSTMNRVRLAAAFEERIQAGARITGELIMIFDRTLSGAERVQVHAAGGAARKDVPDCTARTRVELDFDLSMGGVRYQDVRTVPDPRRDIGIGRHEHRSFPGVAPDYRTIAQLTDILSREDYYVKRVVENPPQAGRQAGRTNRTWDIAGRRYHGVHPIDFHLLVTGEEVEPGTAGRSTTTVRLTVKGTYATAEMEERIVAEWELLWDRIASSVAAGEVGASAEHPGESVSRSTWRMRSWPGCATSRSPCGIGWPGPSARDRSRTGSERS